MDTGSRSVGARFFMSGVPAVLLSVALISTASLLTLWFSIQSIQKTLPAQQLMKVRDFAALHQDLLRLSQALEVYAADPDFASLDKLRLSISTASMRAKYNLKVYGDTPEDTQVFQTNLRQWLAGLEDRLRVSTTQQSPAALGYVAQYIKAQSPQWADLVQQVHDLSQDIFQASMNSAKLQSEQLQTLRLYLFSFIGLTALCAVALSLSLLRQRAAYRQLQVLDNEVRELAFHDPLTHLANRRLVLERLQHFLNTSVRSGQLGALLYLDLDQFKMLNDTEGHDAGDELLRLIAGRLLASVRSADTVARFGGDEFVVLLEDLGTRTEDAAGTAELVAEKIRVAFEQPFHLEQTSGGVWQRSVSIGVSVFGQDPQTVEGVLRQADIALYEAKESGRNAVRFFDAAMQAAVQEHAETEAALRSAIQQQQFSVSYQPVMNLEGKLCGAEALARWRMADGTHIPPAKFIPLAEESGQIVQLGQWILKKACLQWAQWIKEFGNAELRLSVNVSAKQIHQPGFVDDVRDILKTSGLPPQCLVVEVTESVILTNLTDTERKLNALKDMGVGIALDDFGTGYSSLTYVQRLPFSELKIDHSFVADIGIDAGDEAICAATVALARGLNLRIVVEGVETTQQQDFFRDKHPTDYMQGYLYSWPLSADRFATFARGLLQRKPA